MGLPKDGPCILRNVTTAVSSKLVEAFSQVTTTALKAATFVGAGSAASARRGPSDPWGPVCHLRSWHSGSSPNAVRGSGASVVPIAPIRLGSYRLIGVESHRVCLSVVTVLSDPLHRPRASLAPIAAPVALRTLPIERPVVSGAVIEPGGCLFIHERLQRSCTAETHATGLWWLNNQSGSEESNRVVLAGRGYVHDTCEKSLRAWVIGGTERLSRGYSPEYGGAWPGVRSPRHLRPHG